MNKIASIAIDSLINSLVGYKYSRSRFPHTSSPFDAKLFRTVSDGFWHNEFLTSPLDNLTPAVNISALPKKSWSEVYKITFPSIIGEVSNNIVWARLYTPKSNKLSPTMSGPAVLIIPGWLSFNYYAYEGICKAYIKQGFSCLTIALPYHLQRSAPGSFSGELFFTADLVKSVLQMRQALVECRQALAWLNSVFTSISVLGMSLGGYLAGMLSVFEPSLKSAILLVPASNLVEPLMNSSLCKPLKQRILNNNSNTEISYLDDLLDPRSFSPQLDKDRIKFIAGIYDRTIRLEWIEKWCAAWGHDQLEKVQHGHISSLLDRHLIETMASFAISKL